MHLEELPKHLFTGNSLCLENLGLRETFGGNSLSFRAVSPQTPILEFGLTAEKIGHPLIQIPDGLNTLFHIGWQFDSNAHAAFLSRCHDDAPVVIGLTA